MNAQEFINQVNANSINSTDKKVRKNQEIREYAKSLKHRMGAFFGNGSYSTFSKFTDKSECLNVPQKFLNNLETLKSMSA
jgi:hypothetical protein